MDISGRCPVKVLYTQWVRMPLPSTVGTAQREILSPSAVATAPTQWLAGFPLAKGTNLCQHGCRPFLPFHLRQHRLCLGQPEGHVHGPVQGDSSGQFSMGLLALTSRGIQRAQPVVAV